MLAGPPISREATDRWKGAAILLIVAHNFFRKLEPQHGENEFAFDPTVLPKYLGDLSAQPWDVLDFIVCYFGHYGVQPFIFLSAYGLAVSWGNKPLPYGAFVLGRLRKLYPAFAFVAVGFLLAPLVMYGFEEFVTRLEKNALPLVWKLLAVSDFVPGQQFSPVGPWWFFPFIVQTYLLFPLLVRLTERYGPRALLLVTVAAVLVDGLSRPWLLQHQLNLRFSPLGHLPELALGIYLARRGSTSLSWPALIGAAAVFVVGQVNALAWELSALAFTLLFIGAANLLPAPAKLLDRALRFLGRDSLYLFLIHGFLRRPFLDQLGPDSGPGAQAAYSLAFLALVLGLSYASRRAVAWLEDRVARPATPAQARLDH